MSPDRQGSGDRRHTRECSTGSSSLGPGPGQTSRGAPVRPAYNAAGCIDYCTLRDRVSIGDVLRLLEFQPVERNGAQLRGPCPVHGSSSPTSRSFSVNLRQNAFQCFGGRCGAQSNQLDLWAAAQRLPLYDASILLAERLGIEVPRLGGNCHDR